MWSGKLRSHGPYFFEDEDGSAVTVTSARYVEMLLNSHTPELSRWGIGSRPHAHTATASMQVVREMFPERVTSLRGELPWPARSPDLSACDYFLWKYLKCWLVYSCCSQLEHRASVKCFVSLQFLNIRYSVGLLGRVNSPSQGRYLTQTQTNIHALSGIRTHDPSVGASEHSSCLRSRGHCDRRSNSQLKHKLLNHGPSMTSKSQFGNKFQGYQKTWWGERWETCEQGWKSVYAMMGSILVMCYSKRNKNICNEIYVE
jgi:hypothetical protein